MGMNMKEGDYIEHLHICSTHDYLLFFTNRGKVYRLKVYELPEGSRAAKGRALVNVLPLKEKERVMAVIPTRDFSEGKYLVFGTANGMIKKTEFKQYDTPMRADGIIAIKIRKGDELVQVRLTSGKDDIIMVSASGHAARFKEKAVRAMGRDTSGVRGMNVSEKGNRVLAVDVARDEDDLFVLTENGYGKRTRMAEYPVKGRGTKGVLTVKLTTKKGMLAGALVVRAHQELIFISQNGMVQRTSVSGISRMSRPTQGVRVMNLKTGDRVSAVALVVESAAGEGNGSAPVEEAIEGEASSTNSAATKTAAGSSTDGPSSDGAAGALTTAKPKRVSAKTKPPAKTKPAAKSKAAAKPKVKPAPTAKAKAKPQAKTTSKAAPRRKPKANPALASSRKRANKRK